MINKKKMAFALLLLSLEKVSFAGFHNSFATSGYLNYFERMNRASFGSNINFDMQNILDLDSITGDVLSKLSEMDSNSLNIFGNIFPSMSIRCQKKSRIPSGGGNICQLLEKKPNSISSIVRGINFENLSCGQLSGQSYLNTLSKLKNMCRKEVNAVKGKINSVALQKINNIVEKFEVQDENDNDIPPEIISYQGKVNNFANKSEVSLEDMENFYNNLDEKEKKVYKRYPVVTYYTSDKYAPFLHYESIEFVTEGEELKDETSINEIDQELQGKIKKRNEYLNSIYSANLKEGDANLFDGSYVVIKKCVENMVAYDINNTEFATNVCKNVKNYSISKNPKEMAKNIKETSNLAFFNPALTVKSNLLKDGQTRDSAYEICADKENYRACIDTYLLNNEKLEEDKVSTYSIVNSSLSSFKELLDLMAVDKAVITTYDKKIYDKLPSSVKKNVMGTVALDKAGNFYIKKTLAHIGSYQKNLIKLNYENLKTRNIPLSYGHIYKKFVVLY